MLELKLVKLKKPGEVNVILGQSHFIKTVEDLYEVLMNNVPDVAVMLANCISIHKLNYTLFSL